MKKLAPKGLLSLSLSLSLSKQQKQDGGVNMKPLDVKKNRIAMSLAFMLGTLGISSVAAAAESKDSLELNATRADSIAIGAAAYSQNDWNYKNITIGNITTYNQTALGDLGLHRLTALMPQNSTLTINTNTALLNALDNRAGSVSSASFFFGGYYNDGTNDSTKTIYINAKDGIGAIIKGGAKSTSNSARTAINIFAPAKLVIDASQSTNANFKAFEFDFNIKKATSPAVRGGIAYGTLSNTNSINFTNDVVTKQLSANKRLISINAIKNAPSKSTPGYNYIDDTTNLPNPVGVFFNHRGAVDPSTMVSNINVYKPVDAGTEDWVEAWKTAEQNGVANWQYDKHDYAGANFYGYDMTNPRYATASVQAGYGNETDMSNKIQNYTSGVFYYYARWVPDVAKINEAIALARESGDEARANRLALCNDLNARESGLASFCQPYGAFDTTEMEKYTPQNIGNYYYNFVDGHTPGVGANFNNTTSLGKTLKITGDIYIANGSNLNVSANEVVTVFGVSVSRNMFDRVYANFDNNESYYYGDITGNGALFLSFTNGAKFKGNETLIYNAEKGIDETNSTGTILNATSGAGVTVPGYRNIFFQFSNEYNHTAKEQFNVKISGGMAESKYWVDGLTFTQRDSELNFLKDAGIEFEASGNTAAKGSLWVSRSNITLAEDQNFTGKIGPSGGAKFLFGNAPLEGWGGDYADYIKSKYDSNSAYALKAADHNASLAKYVSTANIGSVGDGIKKDISFAFNVNTFDTADSKKGDAEHVNKNKGYTGTILGGTSDSNYLFVNAGYLHYSQIDDAVGNKSYLGNTKLIGYVIGNANKNAQEVVRLGKLKEGEASNIPEFIVGNAQNRNIKFDFTDANRAPTTANVEKTYVAGAANNAQYTIWNLKAQGANTAEMSGISTTATSIAAKDGSGNKTYTNSILGALANASVIFDNIGESSQVMGAGKNLKEGTDLNETLNGTSFTFLGSSLNGNIKDANFSLNLAFDSTESDKSQTPYGNAIQRSSYTGSELDFRDNAYAQSLSFIGADSLKASTDSSAVKLHTGANNTNYTITLKDTDTLLDVNSSHTSFNTLTANLANANAKFGDVNATTLNANISGEQDSAKKVSFGKILGTTATLSVANANFEANNTSVNTLNLNLTNAKATFGDVNVATKLTAVVTGEANNSAVKFGNITGSYKGDSLSVTNTNIEAGNVNLNTLALNLTDVNAKFGDVNATGSNSAAGKFNATILTNVENNISRSVSFGNILGGAGSSLSVTNTNFEAGTIQFNNTNNGTGATKIHNTAEGVKTKLGSIIQGNNGGGSVNNFVSLRLGEGSLESTGQVKGTYTGAVATALGDKNVTSIVLTQRKGVGVKDDIAANTIEIKANNAGGIIEIANMSGSTFTRAGKDDSNQMAKLSTASNIDLRGTSLVGDILGRHGLYLRGIFAGGAGAGDLTNKEAAGDDYIAESKYYGGVIAGMHNTGVGNDSIFAYGAKNTQTQGFWFIGADSHNFKAGSVDENNTIVAYDRNNNNWRGWTTFRFVNADNVDGELFKNWASQTTLGNDNINLTGVNTFNLAGTNIISDINSTEQGSTLGYFNNYHGTGNAGAFWRLNATFDYRDDGARDYIDALSHNLDIVARPVVSEDAEIEIAQSPARYLEVNKSTMNANLTMGTNAIANLRFLGAGSHGFTMESNKSISGGHSTSKFVFDDAFDSSHGYNYESLKNANGTIVIANSNIVSKGDVNATGGTGNATIEYYFYKGGNAQTEEGTGAVKAHLLTNHGVTLDTSKDTTFSGALHPTGDQTIKAYFVGHHQEDIAPLIQQVLKSTQALNSTDRFYFIDAGYIDLSGAFIAYATDINGGGVKYSNRLTGQATGLGEGNIRGCLDGAAECGTTQFNAGELRYAVEGTSYSVVGDRLNYVGNMLDSQGRFGNNLDYLRFTNFYSDYNNTRHDIEFNFGGATKQYVLVSKDDGSKEAVLRDKMLGSIQGANKDASGRASRYVFTNLGVADFNLTNAAYLDSTVENYKNNGIEFDNMFSAVRDVNTSEVTSVSKKTLAASQMGSLQAALINAGVKFYVDGNEQNKTGTIIGLRGTGLALADNYKLNSAQDQKFGYDLEFTETAKLDGELDFANNSNEIALSFKGASSTTKEALNLNLGSGRNTINVANFGDKLVAITAANTDVNSTFNIVDSANVASIDLSRAKSGLRFNAVNSSIAALNLSSAEGNASINLVDSKLGSALQATNLGGDSNVTLSNSKIAGGITATNLGANSIVLLSGSALESNETTAHLDITNLGANSRIGVLDSKIFGNINAANAGESTNIVVSGSSVKDILAQNLGIGSTLSILDNSSVESVNIQDINNSRVVIHSSNAGNVNAANAINSTFDVNNSSVALDVANAKGVTTIAFDAVTGSLNAKNLEANASINIANSKDLALDISSIGEEARIAIVDSKINNLGGNRFIALNANGAGSTLNLRNTDIIQRSDNYGLKAIESTNANDVINIEGGVVESDAGSQYEAVAISTKGRLSILDSKIIAASSAGAVGINVEGNKSLSIANTSISATDTGETALSKKLYGIKSATTGEVSIEGVSVALASNATEYDSAGNAFGAQISKANNINAHFDSITAQKEGARLVGVEIADFNGSVNASVKNINLNAGSTLHENNGANVSDIKKDSTQKLSAQVTGFALHDVQDMETTHNVRLGNITLEGVTTAGAELRDISLANVELMGNINSKGAQDSYGLIVTTTPRAQSSTSNKPEVVSVRNFGNINANYGMKLVASAIHEITNADGSGAGKTPSRIYLDNMGVINAKSREVLIGGDGEVIVGQSIDSEVGIQNGYYTTAMRDYSVDANRPFEIDSNNGNAKTTLVLNGDIRFNRIETLNEFYLNEMVSLGGEAAGFKEINGTKIDGGNVVLGENVSVSVNEAIRGIVDLKLDKETGLVTNSVRAERTPGVVLNKVAISAIDAQMSKMSSEISNQMNAMANVSVGTKRAQTLKEKLAYGGELIQIDVPVQLLTIKSTNKTETFITPYFSRSRLKADDLDGTTSGSGFLAGVTHALGDEQEYLVGIHAGMETRYGNSTTGASDNSSNVNSYIIGAHARARLAKLGDDAVFVRGELNYITGRANQSVTAPFDGSSGSTLSADAVTKGFNGSVIAGYDKALGEDKMLTGELGLMLQQSRVGQTSMDLGALFHSEEVKKSSVYGLANVRYSQNFGVSEWNLVPTITGGVKMLLNNRDYTILTNVGDKNYRSNALLDRYTGMFSLGFNLIHLSDIFRVSLTYTGEFGQYMTTHSINGRVGFKF